MTHRKARVTYCDVTIGVTGIISAEILQENQELHTSAVSMSGTGDLQEALSHLAPGGFFIDLRPLDEHECIASWVVHAPYSSGHLRGTEIEQLPESLCLHARELLTALEGTGKEDIAALAAKIVELVNSPFISPIHHVASEYLAIYWFSRGAKVGRRKGNALVWMDGAQRQPISETS